MTTALRSLLILLFAFSASADSGVSYEGVSRNVVAAPAGFGCPFGDDCDDFSTDTITGGDWVEEGDGVWAISGGTLTNDWETGNGVSRLRRTTTALDADNCQAMEITSDNTISNAPGFVMRSTSATWSSAARLELVWEEDGSPERYLLRSYTSLADSGTIEGTPFNSTLSSFPTWLGACISGQDVSTEISVYELGSDVPDSDVDNWSGFLVGTITRDSGTPTVNTNSAAGLRNYREDLPGAFEISAWFGVNNTPTVPPTMALVPTTSSVSAEPGEVPSPVQPTVSLENSGDSGTRYDWTAAFVSSIPDCSAGAGGTTWVSFLPTGANDVTPASPDVITLDYTDADECDEGVHTATIRFTATTGVPGTPDPSFIDLPITLTIAVPGAWPDEDSTGLYLADRTTLRGQCATLCASGVSSVGTQTTTSNGQTIQCLEISGDLNINHDNVTVRCIELYSTGFRIVSVPEPDTGDLGDNFTLEDSRIDNAGLSGTLQSEVIWIKSGGSFTVSRTEICCGQDLFQIDEANGFVIEDSLLWKMDAPGGTQNHYDGIEMNGGVINGLISGNYVYDKHSDTAAIQINNSAGNMTNIIMDQNYLAGGGRPLSCDARFGGGTISGIQWTDNTWSTGEHGDEGLFEGSGCPGVLTGSISDNPNGPYCDDNPGCGGCLCD